MSEWKQFVFGKVVQTPDGPIVKGKDHECTGRTQGIPDEIFHAMSPDIVGPGISDLTNWSQYLWNDQHGGIAIQSVFAQGKPWIIACRIRGRSEGGEGKIGRFYTQAHYLTIPAEDFNPSCLLGLAQRLRANPMMEKDHDLSPMIVEFDPVPLPSNWMELVFPVVRILLSGLPLAIKSTKLSMAEIESLFHLVFSALPVSLAWRLGARLGAEKAEEDDVPLSLGQAVLSGPRMIGFSISDPQSNQKRYRSIEQAQSHPIVDGALFGDRYLEFLKNKAKDCQTDVDLQMLLKRELSHMKWDYFPLDISFAQAGIRLVQDIFERDALTQIEEAEKGNCIFPDPRLFFAYKQKALVLGLRSVWGMGAVFVSQTITMWPKTWNELPLEHHSIRRLLCLEEVWDEDSIEHLVRVIPTALHEHVESGFLFQLDQKDGDIDFWSALFTRWDALSERFSSLVLQHEKRVFWKMFRSARAAQNIDLLSICEVLPSAQIFIDVQKGILPRENIGKGWFLDVPNDEEGRLDLNWMIEVIMERHFSLACVLLEWIPSSLPIHESFSVPAICSWPLLKNSAERILSSSKNCTEIEVRVLLAASISATETQRHLVAERVRDMVSPNLILLLLGVSCTEKRTKNETDFALILLEYLLGNGQSFLISARLSCTTDVNIRTKARDLLLQYMEKKPDWICLDPELAIVHALFHGINEPTYDEISCERLCFFFSGISKRGLEKNIKRLHTLEAYLDAETDDVSLSPELCDSLLRLNEAEQKKWKKKIENFGLQKEVFWRLIWLYRDQSDVLIDTSPEEELMLLNLPVPIQCRLFCAGIPFSCTPSNEIEEFSEGDLINGLWVSLESDNPNIQRALLSQGLQNIKKVNEQGFEIIRKKSMQKNNFLTSFFSIVQKWTLRDSYRQRSKKWTIEEACIAVLKSLSDSDRASFFSD